MSARDRRMPWGLAGALLLCAVLWHYLLPLSPAVALVAGAAGAAGALLGAWPRLDRTPERVHAALVLLLSGAWLYLAARSGAWAGALILLVAGTVLLGIPWWAHRRVRSDVVPAPELPRAAQREQVAKGEQLKAEWAEAAALAGVEHAEVVSVKFTKSGAWAIRVELPRGKHLEHARSAQRSLESALELPPASIEVEQDQSRARRVLLRLVEDNPLSEPVLWPGPAPDASILKPAQLGVYADGGPLSVLLAYQNVLIAGATDAGKSGALNVLVAYVAAAPDASLWPIDLKGGVELGQWEQVSDMVATTVDDAVEVLLLGQRLLDHRYGLMRSRGQRKWAPTATDPHVIIPVDEARVLFTSDDAVALAEDITGRGRAAAVTLWLSTQYPTVDAVGSSLIVTQCNVRVCLRVNSSREANVILGPGMVGAGWNAHQIPKDQPGTLYLHAAGATTPRLARVFHATDAKIEQVADRLAVEPRPRLVVPALRHRPSLALVPEPDDQDAGGGGEDDVLAILRDAPGPMWFADLVEESSASRATVRRRLTAYRDATPPRAEQLGDGRWRALP